MSVDLAPLAAPPPRPAWSLHAGRLRLHAPALTLDVRPWPSLAAWARVGGSRWTGVRPVLPLATSVDTVIEWGGDAGGAHAAAWFRAAVPPSAWALACRTWERQWHLLALLARVPGAEELASTHLPLAFALATAPELRDGRPAPYRALRALVGRERGLMAAWLGFPGGEATVRVLHRIPASALSLGRLRVVRGLVRRGVAPLVLHQLPVLSAEVIDVLATPRLAEVAPWSLLLELATAPPRSVPVAGLLADALRWLDRLPRERARRPRSVAELVAWHHELAMRAAALGGGAGAAGTPPAGTRPEKGPPGRAAE